MAKTDFCELSDMTSQQTFPGNFGTTWNFFTNPNTRMGRGIGGDLPIFLHNF